MASFRTRECRNCSRIMTGLEKDTCLEQRSSRLIRVPRTRGSAQVRAATTLIQRRKRTLDRSRFNADNTIHINSSEILWCGQDYTWLWISWSLEGCVFSIKELSYKYGRYRWKPLVLAFLWCHNDSDTIKAFGALPAQVPRRFLHLSGPGRLCF